MNNEGWAQLRIVAEVYEDAQKHRIAVHNRIGSDSVPGGAYVDQLEATLAAEEQWKKALKRTYIEVVPAGIREWQQDARGVGEHLLARLLGVIGHPIHTEGHTWVGEGENRELVSTGEFDRRVSDLWAYCGHGDPNRKRRKGMSKEEAAATGSPNAKMITHLLRKSAVQQGVRKVDGAPDEWTPETRFGISPYGKLYQERRILTRNERDWTPLHESNDALRIVGKEILKDLWIAADA